MTTASELFGQALAQHQAGHFQRAEEYCGQALALEPAHAEALHLWGMLAAMKGQPSEGVARIRRAIAANPAQPLFHFNLGVVLQQLRDWAGAARCYRQAVRIKPDYVDALVNLGGTLQAQGELGEAAASFEQVLRIKPDFAEVHANLGTTLIAQGKRAKGLERLRLAVRIKPAYFEGHFNLGNALRDQGEHAAAVTSYEEAIRIKPDYIKAHNNLAVALADHGQLDEAAASYEQVLRLDPNYFAAHSNLGNVLREQGKLDEAVFSCQRALQLKPDYARAHNNLAAALRDQGKLAESVASYRRALQIDPEYAQARSNLGMTLLLAGDLADGWAEYEWRLKCSGSIPSPSCRPLWDGSPLDGRTLLLFAEQGLGDTLQFIRFAPGLQQQGGRILLECQQPLGTLLENCAGFDRVIPRGSERPQFDVAASLLSLPHLLQTTLETIPAAVPYLVEDGALADRWRAELGALAGTKVGISWQGNPEFRGDRWRSIPLHQFEPLSRVPNVTLVNLQKGPGEEQLAEARNRFTIYDLGSRLDEEAGAFMDTAAIMKSLDLVITSDSATAHLAGALGVPVWVALQWIPDWRWLQDREDSPWYPTMRLFRQSEARKWEEVFEAMAVALASVQA